MTRPGLRLLRDGEPVYAPTAAACRVCREPMVTSGYTADGTLLILPHRCPGRRLTPAARMAVFAGLSVLAFLVALAVGSSRGTW